MRFKPLLSRLAIALYLLLLVLVMAGAVYAWRLRCEGFGCTGVGIVWFAWSLLYLLALVLGWAAGPLARPWPAFARLCRAAMALQLLLGAALAAAWVIHQAR